MIQVIDSMPWVRCASGNVSWYIWELFALSLIFGILHKLETWLGDPKPFCIHVQLCMFVSDMFVGKYLFILD